MPSDEFLPSILNVNIWIHNGEMMAILNKRNTDAFCIDKATCRSSVFRRSKEKGSRMFFVCLFFFCLFVCLFFVFFLVCLFFVVFFVDCLVLRCFFCQSLHVFCHPTIVRPLRKHAYSNTLNMFTTKK